VSYVVGLGDETEPNDGTPIYEFKKHLHTGSPDGLMKNIIDTCRGNTRETYGCGAAAMRSFRNAPDRCRTVFTRVFTN